MSKTRNPVAWGYSEDAFTEIERRRILPMASAWFGRALPEAVAAPAAADIALPASRLRIPDALLSVVADDHAVRLLHARGRSFPDLVDLRGETLASVPDAVAEPRDEAELLQVLSWCDARGLAVIPFGGGSSVVGGVTPEVGEGWNGVVTLSMPRMAAVLDIDVEAQSVHAQAGIFGPDLEAALKPRGLAVRHFPQSYFHSTLGGWAATRGAGHFATQFAKIEDRVQALRVVTGDGRIAETQRLPAGSVGVDPNRLWCGSEGTLGIITAAVLKLFPRPKGREVAWVGLRSPEAALSLFSLASERAGASLTAFELMIGESLVFVLRHVPGAAAPLASAHPWHVLMEISSGRSSEDARGLIEEILAEGIERGLVGDAVLAASMAQAEALWKLRESMSDAQRHEGASIKHDISVPVAAIPDFIAEAWRAVTALEPRARLVAFGHMGDGNLHYNVSQPVGVEPASFLARYREINDAVHAVVRGFNGSISAEHGIGRMKRDELIATAPPVAIDLMRRIKIAFDPAGIMNPNKVI